MVTVAMRLRTAASWLGPANSAWSCASSGARTDACHRPALSVVTCATSIQWSLPTSRPRSWICCPATALPLCVSRPEMSNDCQAAAVVGVWIDISMPAGLLDGGAGAVGTGAGFDGVDVVVVVVVVRMFASARSCVRVPWNLFMSVCARMPVIRLLLEYCQNVQVFHAPPNVFGRLP